MFQTTFSGVAVAVAVTGPAVAAAVARRQVARSIHSQDATWTSWSRLVGGAIWIVPVGSASSEAACRATAAGETGGTAPFAWETQNGGMGSIVPGPAQMGITHCPGWGPP